MLFSKFKNIRHFTEYALLLLDSNNVFKRLGCIYIF